uniref:AlNc14C80G5252 protein n=1 Tax=Albugo laibachii Nc14 TaxID=890382 RepID=F0WF58_9STRA|nr:AlNc14C80G5252 [Albugo laibachii Nc14]|eukprot:CCA19840.1 AlNc14C80G5252 [Albugo laibachii Nc14]
MEYQSNFADMKISMLYMYRTFQCDDFAFHTYRFIFERYNMFLPIISSSRHNACSGAIVGKTTRDLHVNTRKLLGNPVNKNHTRKVGVLMPERK